MMIVIAGGFVLREYVLPGLLEYEKLNYERNRQLVNQEFDELRDLVPKFPYAPSDTAEKLVRPFEDENINQRVKADRVSHRSLFERFSAQPTWGGA
jgi:hypothetical protein